MQDTTTELKPWFQPDLEKFHPHIQPHLVRMKNNYLINNLLENPVVKISCPVNFSILRKQSEELIEKYIKQKICENFSINIGRDDTFFTGDGYRLLFHIREGLIYNKNCPKILLNYMKEYFPNIPNDPNNKLSLVQHGNNLESIWKTTFAKKHKIFIMIKGKLSFDFKDKDSIELNENNIYVVDFFEWHKFKSIGTSIYFAFDAEDKDWEKYVI